MGSITYLGHVIRQEDRKWNVYKDGVLVIDEWQSRQSFGTRKAAMEAVRKLAERAEYVARITCEDRTGVYVWTEQESASIDELAAALKVNAPGKGFDRRPMQARSRKEYVSDGNTIKSWYAWEKHDWEGNVIVIELRRKRAARREAYRRSGISFDPNSYILVIKSHRSPGKTDRTSYESVAECKKARDQIIRLCEPQESYDFSIETVPPSWPTDRI